MNTTMNKGWTTDQELLFIEKYPVLPKSELAELFPGLELKSKAKRMGLKKKGKLYSYRYADELKLIEIYADTLNADLAEMMSKTKSSIEAAAFKLNLRKSEEFMRFHSSKTWIKAGNVPFNKGKKQEEYMTAEQIKKSKVHRYKKGHIPHNAYEKDGIITVRYDKRGMPYQFIRIALGEWIALHVHVWEEKHGKLAKGHCVFFKDGDTMNCEPENLERITRAENALRNSGSIHLPDSTVATYMATTSRKVDVELKNELLKRPELIKLKRNQLLLNREIKKQHDNI